MTKKDFLAMLIAAKLEADTKQTAKANASDFWSILPDYNPLQRHAGQDSDDCCIRIIRSSEHRQAPHGGGTMTRANLLTNILTKIKNL